MAFIPDEAARSGSEVSVFARVLYTVYCSHRSESGVSRVNDRQAMEESGISRASFFRAKKELKDKSWIEVEEEGVRCVKGDFRSAGQACKGTAYKNGNGNNGHHPHKVVHESEALDLFIRVLGSIPAPKDQEAIKATITDMAQWQESVSYWKYKSYKVTNVDGLVDNYRRHLAKKPAKREVIRTVMKPQVEKQDEIEKLLSYVEELERELNRDQREPNEWEAALIELANKHRKQPILFGEVE